MSIVRPRNQRGFTLIELLAVMAIVSVLAGIVSVAVGGTSETSKDTQTKQDANTLETAASDFFSDQEGAEILTTKTVQVQSLSGIVQQISSRWPEQYITDVYSAAFFDETGGGTGDTSVNSLFLLTADGLSTISIQDLLTNFNAIDFPALVAGDYMAVEPDESTTLTGDRYFNYLWLFKKTTAAGGSSEGSARQVAVFKLLSVRKIEGGDLVDLTYAQLVGEFTSATVSQVISNGSFEDGDFTLSIGHSIDHWTIESGDIDKIGRDLWDPSDGEISIDMNGSEPGTIRQSFDTVPGRQYKVLFDMAGNWGLPDPDADKIVAMDVAAAGSSQSYSFNFAGRSAQDMGYGEKTFFFKATSSTTKLVFESTNLDGFFNGPVLDNVRVSLN